MRTFGAHRLATVSFIVAASMIAGTVSAFAGSNGQQLELFSDGCASVYAHGTNQSGTNQDIHFATPGYDTKWSGAWWVGPLIVDCFDSTGVQSATSTLTNVPSTWATDYYPVPVQWTSATPPPPPQPIACVVNRTCSIGP